MELYDQALSDFRDEPFLKNLVLASLGYAHIRQTDYPEAVKFFEMVAQAPGSAMADEALFNLGELYATMGQYEKSKDAYNKILTNHAGSMYVDMVKEKVDRQKK